MHWELEELALDQELELDRRAMIDAVIEDLHELGVVPGFSMADPAEEADYQNIENAMREVDATLAESLNNWARGFEVPA